MSYDSNKASLADANNTDTTDKEPLGPMASNQEQSTGTGVRTVSIDTSGSSAIGYTSTQRKLSNQLQMGPNGKGTATLKDPLNSYASKVYPAVANPSARQPDSEGGQYANKAAGRNVNGSPNL